MNVSSLLKRTAGRYPSKTAIVEGKRKISYKRLWQEIESLSNAFRSIGIMKNTKVAILLPNCKEFIYSFFALLNINAIAVPLKPDMTCWELAGILKNCTPKVVILTPNLLNKILTDTPSLLGNRIIIVKEEKVEIPILDKDGYLENARVCTLDDLREMGKKENPVKRKKYTYSKHVASINYTYRGHGYPLGAVHSHTNYIHGAVRYIKFFNITFDTTMLLILPIYHIFALIGCTIAPLIAGANVVIEKWKSPRKILPCIEKYSINILTCIPRLYYLLLKEFDRNNYNLSSLSFGISGGESISPALITEIKNKMKINILNGYGLTECMPVIGNPPIYGNGKGIGIPGHDVRIKVVNERGIECRPGEIGEIVVQCPSVMSEYYQAPNETSAVIKKGWFYTGDMGIVGRDGYVYFKGLKKDIAKIDGITVDIAEVRNRILSVKQVEDVKVDVQEDDVLGHKIIATVRLNKGSDAFTVKDLRRFLRKHLGFYKMPAELTVC